MAFWTRDGVAVPAVTARQMREVDRIAVQEFGLGILQMMENAGRNLAENALDMLGGARGREVTVLAGMGGNGGGGLCCARHLLNRGLRVWVVLNAGAENFKGAAGVQLGILQAAGSRPLDVSQAGDAIRSAQLVVDALIGYGLRGAPRGKAAQLIELCNQHAARVLSLDVPSGLDSTTGAAPGQVVRPERTLTLALPKTGLQGIPGDLYLADIGIPPQVYERLKLSTGQNFCHDVGSLFENRYWFPLEKSSA
jgi:NAD(P)H-hydrate epimerase